MLSRKRKTERKEQLKETRQQLEEARSQRAEAERQRDRDVSAISTLNDRLGSENHIVARLERLITGTGA